VVTLEQVDVIKGAINRTVGRFHLCDGATMPNNQWRAYRAWVRARYNLLREHYAAAINDCDNIIGKQWHFDNTTDHLPPEHGSG
jgi:hypothetical protein